MNQKKPIKHYKLVINNKENGPYTEDKIIELIKNGFVPTFAKIVDESNNSVLAIKSEKFSEHFKKSTIEKKNNKDLFSFEDEENESKKVDFDFGIKLEIVPENTEKFLEKSRKSGELVNKNLDLDKTVIIQEKFIPVVRKSNGKPRTQESTENIEKESDQKENTNKNKKLFKSKFTFILAVLFIIFMLLSEDDEVQKENKIVYSKVSIPVSERIDLGKSDELFKLGKLELSKKGFGPLWRSSQLFKQSFQLNPDNMKVLEFLLLSYSRLMIYSQNQESDAIKIYQLFRLLGDRNLITNRNYLVAQSYFFLNTGKLSTAKYMIEKYLSINKKMDDTILNLYFKILLKLGEIEKLQTLYNKVKSLKEMNVELYQTFFTYLLKYQKLKEYSSLNASFNRYKHAPEEKNSYFLLKAKNYYLSENIGEMNSWLIKYEKSDQLKNKIQESTFYELKGIYSVSQNKTNEAIKYFNKSIEYNTNRSLVEKLSALKPTNNNIYDSLILKSKMDVLIQQSKSFIKEEKWEMALTRAIEAVDLQPESIDSNLLLVRLQLQAGNFDNAILNLENLHKKNTANKKLIIELITAYSKVYKFKKIEDLIRTYISEDFKSNSDYANAMSLYFYQKKDKIKSILWLHRAVKLNPLNDKFLFRLATIYLEHNKFDKAKKIINRAIKLNPIDIQYRILYSKILYETENVDIAVGYLRSLMEDFGNLASFKNQIAIFYYRSGQIKGYKELRKKLVAVNDEGKELLSFLVRAAKTDGNLDDVIKYSERLSEKDPADLESMMKLTEILMEKKQYDRALDQLKLIYNKMKTYPRVEYYRSRLYFLLGKTDKAIEFAKKEIENNPFFDDGHNILGEIYISKKDYNLAEQEFKTAQKLNNKSIRAMKGLAFVKFKKNLHEPALDLYKKAKKLDPNDSDVYFQLGEVYRQLGMSKDAVESYKTYLELRPDSEYKDKVEKIIRVLE
jgi:tetratricopeptide (TPR) repeat protein